MGRSEKRTGKESIRSCSCMSLFDGTYMMKSMNILEKGLDAITKRREILANNIANADTPGFKRSDLVFESELKRALDSEKVVESEPRLQTLHKGHIAHREPGDYRHVEPSVVTDYLSTMRNDGNNVDMETEMTQAVRNQMEYSLLVDRIGGDLRLMNQLIRLA